MNRPRPGSTWCRHRILRSAAVAIVFSGMLACSRAEPAGPPPSRVLLDSSAGTITTLAGSVATGSTDVVSLVQVVPERAQLVVSELRFDDRDAETPTVAELFRDTIDTEPSLAGARLGEHAYLDDRGVRHLVFYDQQRDDTGLVKWLSRAADGDRWQIVPLDIPGRVRALLPGEGATAPLLVTSRDATGASGERPANSPGVQTESPASVIRLTPLDEDDPGDTWLELTIAGSAANLVHVVPCLETPSLLFFGPVGDPVLVSPERTPPVRLLPLSRIDDSPLVPEPPMIRIPAAPEDDGDGAGIPPSENSSVLRRGAVACTNDRIIAVQYRSRRREVLRYDWTVGSGEDSVSARNIPVTPAAGTTAVAAATGADGMVRIVFDEWSLDGAGDTIRLLSAVLPHKQKPGQWRRVQLVRLERTAAVELQALMRGTMLVVVVTGERGSEALIFDERQIPD